MICLEICIIYLYANGLKMLINISKLFYFYFSIAKEVGERIRIFGVRNILLDLYVKTWVSLSKLKNKSF